MVQRYRAADGALFPVGGGDDHLAELLHRLEAGAGLEALGGLPLMHIGLAERGGLRPWLVVGLGFLALALAGAPFTSGALAKSALSDSLSQAAPVLVMLLAASTLARCWPDQYSS